jgi:hypothetical protein
LSIIFFVFHTLEEKKKYIVFEICMKLAEKETKQLSCLAMPAPRAPPVAPPTQAAIYITTSESE